MENESFDTNFQEVISSENTEISQETVENKFQELMYNLATVDSRLNTINHNLYRARRGRYTEAISEYKNNQVMHSFEIARYYNLPYKMAELAVNANYKKQRPSRKPKNT